MQYDGKLIALEGEDDQLLTAQMEKLHSWLQHQGLVAIKTSNPTNGPAGAQIKLHQQGRLSFGASCLAMLWMADRMDHLSCQEGILSQLSRGRHVMCSRYWLYSYVHLLDHVALDWHLQVNALCKLPDLTLYIDTPRKKGSVGYRDAYLHVIDRLAQSDNEIVKVDGGSRPNVLDGACQHSIARLLSLGDG